jgi:hypothetical protein
MDADDSEESRSILRAARKAGRQIVSPDGAPFSVYELGSRYDRRGAALIFESDHVVRRVRAYPPNWRDLSDYDLYMVSWGA